MPVTPSTLIKCFSQDEFHAVDRVVKGHSFDIHNQLGRFLDESLYQNELALRLQNTGHNAEREVLVTLSLNDFSHEYYIDLLIDSGVVVETKVAEKLTSAHYAQTLNYLYITGLQHGTLINFRPESVESQFVSSKLTFERRQRYSVDIREWQPFSASCERLLNSLRLALSEWGWGLHLNLYREYLIHALGGMESVIQEIPVVTQHGSIGRQPTPLISREIAFALTAFTNSTHFVREHQFRFLKHTNLNAIHWINMNRGEISLETLTK